MNEKIEIKIEIKIDLRTIPEKIGFITQSGERVFRTWDWANIERWIDGKLDGANPRNSTVVLYWTHLPDWLSMKIGSYLDSRVQNILISTPRTDYYAVKGGVR